MGNDSKPKTITVKAGETIIQEKKPCHALFIIQEGQLEVYKVKDGERIPLAVIGSGEYVGEAALLLNRPHTSNVVALTDCKLTQIDKESIDAQLKNTPPWFLSLTKGLITRLHKLNDVLQRNGLVDESIANKVKALEDNSKKTA